MAKNQLNLDFRYYESKVPNVDGVNPGDLGKILKLPKSTGLTGARIALKLRELGFKTGTFSHIYINFSTVVPAGEIRWADRSIDEYHPWFRFVDVGVNSTKVNKLSPKKRLDWLETVTMEVAAFLAGKNKQQRNIVDELGDLLKAHGDELPIRHKTKETKSYSVVVSYQISSQIGKSTAWVEYENKRSGERRLGCFATLKNHDDILFLVSSVSVKSGIISFKPRASFKASLYNKRYNIPLAVEIEKLATV